MVEGRTAAAAAAAAAAEYQLPQDLEKQALERFDALLSEGKIIYEVGDKEVLLDCGFRFEFRIIPGFKKKPILSADDPNRAKKSQGPFLPPKPEEIVYQVGETHNILINKYATHRPMLVVPTQKFALQTDDLNQDDIHVAWSILERFETPSVIFYNCGIRSGSSQGHKHFQLFPAHVHDLWPAKASSTTVVSQTLEGVPFKHFVLRLANGTRADDLLVLLDGLVDKARKALEKANSDSRDYNVALSKEWIAVIPRRTAGPEGPFGANAAGMLGMVAVPDKEQREQWTRLGHAKYLAELGVPVDAA